MKYFLIILIIFLISVIPLFCENQDTTGTLRRYAMVIGSNDGGSNRVQLRYATKDALSFVKVMKDMGALADDDLLLLLNPENEEINEAFTRLKEKVNDSNYTPGRKELIIYFSGHSDEEGLLLNGKHFTYKMFKENISSIQADVRVAILDSCSSGAFTRTKGVIRRQPFLVDASSEMKGYAYLTSSADDEYAQESDKIQASFFTHYLISGLRGAADVSRDGLVTLNEAYSFAFRETLARTERTQYGPQHPKYDIQLTGTGDLVLTDLRETSAGLLLAEEIHGRLFVRDKAGNLIVELNKAKGNIIELGLEPGEYQITVDASGQFYESNITLEKDQQALLAEKNLKNAGSEQTIARGNEAAHSNEDTHTPDYSIFSENILSFTMSNKENEDKLGIINLSLFPNFWETDYSYIVSLNLLFGKAKNIYACGLSSIGSMVTHDVLGYQGSGIFNYAGGNIYGAQAAGIGNIALGNLSGYQGGGIFNYTEKNMSVLQTAGIFNYSGAKTIGAQLGGIGNISMDDVIGAQVGGIFNYTKGNIIGAQVGGISNIGGDVTGTQIAGCGNYSDAITGTQISGMFNRTGNLAGSQIGLVNVANNVRGLQLGLVNYAHKYEGGIPIGLISIERTGIFHIDYWYDSASYSHVSFRTGTKYSYFLLTGAFRPDTDPLLWSYGIGWGLHLPLSMFYMETDISCNYMNSGQIEWKEHGLNKILPVLRLTAGLEFWKFSIFGGIKLDAHCPGLYTDDSAITAFEMDIFPFDEPVKFIQESYFGISFHI